jgi:Txe/YoeB family toxin of Txe-Axe toxin-antitoxin module
MIKSVTQHSYFEKKPNKLMGRVQNNPSIGWVHPKSTHSYFEKKLNKLMGRLQNNPSIGWVHPKSTHAHPLTWDNNNKIIIHSLKKGVRTY